MTSNKRYDSLAELSAQGVAVWLDDLSRELLASGELQSLITGRHVVGVTTNPTIFASALATGDRYDGQLSHLAELGASTETAIFTVTTDDVRAACDVLSPVYQQTAATDGRVSIEVDPRLARDAAATADMARALRSAVDRDNMFVKIPATPEGLTAITQVTSEGISVNVTLIFALARYRAVMDAYLSGLEQAAAAGRDLAAIRSVASFFISRVDSEVDTRLDQIATSQATQLKGKAAIANARLAYQAYEEVIASQRWQQLAGLGAQPQRPLWASTGVKNHAYPDTMYVTELVAADTVNTMPATTLAAFADHGEVTGNSFPFLFTLHLLFHTVVDLLRGPVLIGSRLELYQNSMYLTTSRRACSRVGYWVGEPARSSMQRRKTRPSHCRNRSRYGRRTAGVRISSASPRTGRMCVTSAVGVKDRILGERVITGGHLDGLLDERGLVIIVRGPPDHSLRVAVDDRGQEKPALPRRNVCMSPTIFSPGASAVKSRFTRSGMSCSWPSPS